MAGDRVFARWMAKVIGNVEAPGAGLDLPLDIRSTAFLQRVWRALTSIPPGATVSYACAANKITMAIPCHRVVRTDGAVSGDRCGVKRKRELLEREKVSQ